MAIIYSIGTHCSNVETVKQRSLKILSFCHPQGWWLLLHVNDHLDFERPSKTFIKIRPTIVYRVSSRAVTIY